MGKDANYWRKYQKLDTKGSNLISCLQVHSKWLAKSMSRGVAAVSEMEVTLNGCTLFGSRVLVPLLGRNGRIASRN